jgi:hypothetical protein
MDSRTKPSRRLERLGTRGRILLGWGLIIAAIVLLAVGWYGVSGTPRVERQLAYLVSGGFGGLLAGIVGIGLLVSLDVRRDRERLGRVEAAILELREMLLAQAETKADGRNGTGRSGGTPRKKRETSRAE